MKIRHVLPTAVVGLAVLLLGVSGASLREAVIDRGNAEAFLGVNRTAELLLEAAGAWAFERGMTNGTDTGSAATDVLGAAFELSRQSSTLNDEIDRFLVGIRAA